MAAKASDPPAGGTASTAAPILHASPIEPPLPVDSLLAEDKAAVIHAMAVDPRGEWLAIACDDRSVRILEIASMSTVAVLQGHRDAVRAVNFDSYGSRLASSGNDGQVLVWSRDDWSRPIEEMTIAPAIASVCFSPDGRELAVVGFDKGIRILGESSRHASSLRCECGDLRVIGYRPDHRFILVAGRSGKIYFYDPRSGVDLGGHSVHRSRIRDLAFRRDGTTVVSVGEDGALATFDSERRELIRRVEVTSGRLFALALLDERHAAVAGSDDRVRIIDLDSGRVVVEAVGHQGSVTALAVVGDRLISGGFDGVLRQWRLQGAQSPERIAEGDVRLDR